VNLRAIVSLVFFLVATPSFAGLFSDDEARQKVGELQTQVEAIAVRISTLEEAAKSRGLLDLMTQIQTLSAEVTKLRGQIEVLNNSADAAQKRQKDMYIDLDSRLRTLEQTAAAPKVVEPGPVASVPTTKEKPSRKNESTKPSVNATNENRVYEDAYNMFKTGNYQGAIVAFQDFIKAYPASSLAASAQYWIGNSFFAIREYKNAIVSQNKLIATYPESPKVPDAMLNIASAKMELGEEDQAKKTLQELIAKFPVTDAAETAKRRLVNMKN
jgi:tol-pal system protein YbgF